MDARAQLEFGIDDVRGIIPLVGEVNEQMYARLVSSLIHFNQTLPPAQGIIIKLNTYGGDLYQALAIFDTIKTLDRHVTIECIGPVMSAGTIILQSADTRLMSPRSYLMMHYGQDASDSEQLLLHNTRLLKEMKDLFKARTKVATRTLNGWFTKDTYYDSTQALRLGIIDGIIPYVKTEKASGN